jgi:alpha-D-ribose 1-methylphosphonate 5-triphosphate synthase subunit PhnL
VLVLDSPTVGLAADAAAAVADLAHEEAARGVLVLWLEQDRRAGPAAPLWRLVSGSLSALAEE